MAIRRFRRWTPWVVALAGVVAAATFGSVLVRERSTESGLETASRSFVAALLSYDVADLDSAKDRMRPLATDRFYETYESTLTALAEVNARSEGRATQIFVAEVTGDKAATVVMTDSRAETGSGARTSTGSYLRLDLRRSGGSWRVDAVVELAPGRTEAVEP